MSRPSYPEGTRVRFEPKPTSYPLYESPPTPGEEGTVVAVSVGRGKRTSIPGPGGGLVYVNWAKTGTMGVSTVDLVRVGKAKPRARKGNPASGGSHEDEVISAEDVASLPVGSVVFEHGPLWPRSSGGALVVVDGGLLPTFALPSSHEFAPPRGEPAEQWTDRFVVAKRGTGKVPLHSTVDRFAVEWMERRRGTAKGRKGNPAKPGKVPAATTEEAQALALLLTTQGEEGPWLAPVSIATWQSLVAKGWAAGTKTKDRHITTAGSAALRESRAYKKAVASGDTDAVYTLANLAKGGRKHNPAAPRFEVWSKRGMREYATGSFEKARSEAQTCCGEEPTYIVDTEIEGDNVVWRSTGAKGHHRRENPAKAKPRGKGKQAPKREVEVSPALRDMVRKATGKACFKRSCFLPGGSKAGR